MPMPTVKEIEEKLLERVHAVKHDVPAVIEDKRPKHVVIVLPASSGLANLVLVEWEQKGYDEIVAVYTTTTTQVSAVHAILRRQ